MKNSFFTSQIYVLISRSRIASWILYSKETVLLYTTENEREESEQKEERREIPHYHSCVDESLILKYRFESFDTTRLRVLDVNPYSKIPGVTFRQTSQKGGGGDPPKLR